MFIESAINCSASFTVSLIVVISREFFRNASVQQGARGARTEKKFWRPRVGVASIERAMSSDFRVESWRFLGGHSRKIAF